jgi:hypothetical protein
VAEVVIQYLSRPLENHGFYSSFVEASQNLLLRQCYRIRDSFGWTQIAAFARVGESIL